MSSVASLSIILNNDVVAILYKILDMGSRSCSVAIWSFFKPTLIRAFARQKRMRLSEFVHVFVVYRVRSVATLESIWRFQNESDLEVKSESNTIVR